jgi:hypothetical protein
VEEEKVVPEMEEEMRRARVLDEMKDGRNECIS